MTPPDDYVMYGDRSSDEPAAPGARTGRAAPPCPGCGSNRFEDGFVEGTSDSFVRYYGSPREDGFFGVRRFGLTKRTVIARRCLGCSRLDLFAGDAV
ncbi:MAG TPA: hypothetical protein VGC37_15065 [Friedmanniella sp.]